MWLLTELLYGALTDVGAENIRPASSTKIPQQRLCIFHADVPMISQNLSSRLSDKCGLNCTRLGLQHTPIKSYIWRGRDVDAKTDVKFMHMFVQTHAWILQHNTFHSCTLPCVIRRG